ncbi:hypothetical protein BDY19DRAFT_612364 [Irpex rosettiformis]|uniref:Uncharacterized protein n=1 Tax=Irpex rosettiformis TaxID=378272 RepID=A0ACB8TPD6_9APHY|nr:hypothetical protein BDY19DRAFT_612364 [Irpex rosettiformis]
MRSLDHQVEGTDSRTCLCPLHSQKLPILSTTLQAFHLVGYTIPCLSLNHMSQAESRKLVCSQRQVLVEQLVRQQRPWLKTKGAWIVELGVRVESRSGMGVVVVVGTAQVKGRLLRYQSMTNPLRTTHMSILLTRQRSTSHRRTLNSPRLWLCGLV